MVILPESRIRMHLILASLLYFLFWTNCNCMVLDKKVSNDSQVTPVEKTPKEFQRFKKDLHSNELVQSAKHYLQLSKILDLLRENPDLAEQVLGEPPDDYDDSNYLSEAYGRRGSFFYDDSYDMPISPSQMGKYKFAKRFARKRIDPSLLRKLSQYPSSGMQRPDKKKRIAREVNRVEFESLLGSNRTGVTQNESLYASSSTSEHSESKNRRKRYLEGPELDDYRTHEDMRKYSSGLSDYFGYDRKKKDSRRKRQWILENGDYDRLRNLMSEKEYEKFLYAMDHLDDLSPEDLEFYLSKIPDEAYSSPFYTDLVNGVRRPFPPDSGRNSIQDWEDKKRKRIPVL